MSFGNDPLVRANVLKEGAFGFMPKNENLPALYDLMIEAVNLNKKDRRVKRAVAGRSRIW